MDKIVFKNSFWLMLVHLLGYIVPLIEMSILGRALGPDGFGLIVVSLSIILILSIFVEYGFNLVGAREVAKLGSEAPELASLVSNIFTAKLILCFFLMIPVTVIALYGALPNVPASFTFPLLIYFIGLAFSPFWFFHGLNIMLKPVFFNIALRFVSLFILWLLVHEKEDMLLALYVIALTGLLNTVVTTVWMLNKIKHKELIRLDIESGLRLIRKGFSAFIYKGSSDISAASSVVVLGSFSGGMQAGFYAPVDKLVRSATGLAAPILTAFYPYLAVRKKNEIMHKGLLVSFVFFIFGMLGAIIFMFIGAYLIDFIVGEEFEQSYSLVSVFALFIPLKMFNQSVGMAILLPIGKEIIGARLLVVYSLSILIFGAYFSSLAGAQGMVWTLVVLEFLLCVCLMFTLFLLRRELRG